MLRLPLRLIPSEMPLRILQGPLRGYRWIAASSNHGCWLGSYEYAKQRLFARRVHVGDVVFDVGANVGFYTLLAAARVGETGRVIAFEPLPKNVQRIHQHLRLNRLENVQVMEAAVGARSGTARFQPHASNAMGKVSANGIVGVELVSLDVLTDSKSIPDPTLIKIDVEGAELDVLKGAARTLDRARPAILLATHGSVVHRACCDFLRAAGYSLAPSDTSVASIDDTDEILATPV
ncbi:MAG TPA: FkbM family methyltransferase [Gemmatimonadaceae bacterium]|nr:FkbM family methyltransferase [Gemmatimonadaceae bacterium]